MNNYNDLMQFDLNKVFDLNIMKNNKSDIIYIFTQIWFDECNQ